MVNTPSSLRRFAWGPWLLGATLLLGAALRLIWGETIEFKEDEAWLFRLVSDHCIHGEWSPLGMPSSQHVRVPGLSVWVCYPLGHLFGVDEPTSRRGVQWSSVAALVGMVLFAWRCVPAAERESWLWAAAILAVNPMAVLYHRKLWPPCMLPMFCMLFAFGWWYRNRRWGALFGAHRRLSRADSRHGLSARTRRFADDDLDGSARRALGLVVRGKHLRHTADVALVVLPHVRATRSEAMPSSRTGGSKERSGCTGSRSHSVSTCAASSEEITPTICVGRLSADILRMLPRSRKCWPGYLARQYSPWPRSDGGIGDLVSDKPTPNSLALLVRAGFVGFGLLLTLTQSLLPALLDRDVPAHGSVADSADPA